MYQRRSKGIRECRTVVSTVPLAALEHLLSSLIFTGIQHDPA